MTASALEPIEVRKFDTIQTNPVYVLHGGPGGQGSAHGLAELLSNNFRVVEPIQRASGSVRLTVDQHVRDLADVLESPATLVGWSWGAMLALSAAASRPELISGVVVIGCGTYDNNSRSIYNRALAGRLSPSHTDQLARLTRIAENASRGRDARNRAFAKCAQIIEECQSKVSAKYYMPIEVADKDGFDETWADVLRLQEDDIEPQRFSQIVCPVRMIHGSEDPHPGRPTYETLRQFIEDIEYHEIQGAGHKPWVESATRDLFQRKLVEHTTELLGSGLAAG
ncbi:MAG: alpha/beta hydrolase [Actinomycetia bacterium]|nr:alpha/beta hydrolase [Actinomycetes bacterium]